MMIGTEPKLVEEIINQPKYHGICCHAASPLFLDLNFASFKIRHSVFDI